MKISLPADSPLAKAIRSAAMRGGWLVLKTPIGEPYAQVHESTFRARIDSCTETDDTMTVELVSFEDYLETQARNMGL